MSGLQSSTPAPSLSAKNPLQVFKRLYAVSGQDSKTTLTRITVNHTPRLANGDILRHQPVLQLMHSKSADDESVSLVFADKAKLSSLRKSLNSYRGPKAVQAAITAQCRA